MRLSTGSVAAAVLSLAVLGPLGCSVASTGPDPQLGRGNGTPSGPHYNLNILGVPRDKTADMTGNNGHRIFVKLESMGFIR
jgi:hypothetical protein